jgi:hypothetical protein
MNLFEVHPDHLSLVCVRAVLDYDALAATFCSLGEDVACCLKAERHPMLSALCNLGLALGIGCTRDLSSERISRWH